MSEAAPAPARSTPSLLHESIVLPLLFLTVAMAAGFRLTLAGEVQLLAPSLMNLVLAGLLVGALVQARVVRPQALLLERASLLDLASGIVLLIALFAASAQIMNGLLPESGFLSLLFNIFFAVLLSNTIVADPNAPRLLRSLAVTFAWGLLMKFVLLAGLDAPEAGITARLARTLLRGATLGTLPLDSWSPAVGYVMFMAVVLYLAGLWLLSRLARTA